MGSMVAWVKSSVTLSPWKRLMVRPFQRGQQGIVVRRDHVDQVQLECLGLAVRLRIAHGVLGGGGIAPRTVTLGAQKRRRVVLDLLLQHRVHRRAFEDGVRRSGVGPWRPSRPRRRLQQKESRRACAAARWLDDR